MLARPSWLFRANENALLASLYVQTVILGHKPLQKPELLLDTTLGRGRGPSTRREDGYLK